jgi:hypothetical protein
MHQSALLLRTKWDGSLRERRQNARELHETRPHGNEGLNLQTHSVADRLPAHHSNRDKIESSLDQAAAPLGEARAALWPYHLAASQQLPNAVR